jgi:hypothetical protein
MASTQPLYIIHHNGDAFSTQTPRILGVFSTCFLAINAVETLTRTREPSYSHSGILDYVVRDGSIKIVTALLNGNIASTSTIYLTVDAGANAIVETEPFLTEDEAWDACLGFKAKRGGDNWVKEREWQDGISTTQPTDFFTPFQTSQPQPHHPPNPPP